jgi:hypothetical protein
VSRPPTKSGDRRNELALVLWVVAALLAAFVLTSWLFLRMYA